MSSQPSLDTREIVLADPVGPEQFRVEENVQKYWVAGQTEGAVHLVVDLPPGAQHRTDWAAVDSPEHRQFAADFAAAFVPRPGRELSSRPGPV